MKKLLVILLSVLMVLSLAGCGATSSSAAPAPPSSANPSQSSDSPSEPAAGAKTKIGVAACHYTNSWNVTNTEDIVNNFKDAGYDVVWNEAKNDTATQIANVNDLIAQGIEWLIMKPKEEEGLVPALEACKKAGVKVILVDRTVNATPGEDFVTAIRTNAMDGGLRVGEWLADNFPNGANAIEISGTAGSTTSIERAEGVRKSIEGKNINILESQTADFKRTDAQSVTENLYQAHGDKIDIIISQSDEMTMGVLQAIDGLGLTPGEDITIVSIGDGSSTLLDEVIAGRVACVSECTPFLGAQCLEVVKAVEAGQTVETQIWANDRFFTAENANAEKEKATW